MSARFCKSIVLSVVAAAMLLVGMGSGMAIAEERAAGNSGATKTEAVELNSATVEQLIALPGIGKITAERIVAFRKELDFAKEKYYYQF